MGEEGASAFHVDFEMDDTWNHTVESTGNTHTWHTEDNFREGAVPSEQQDDEEVLALDKLVQATVAVTVDVHNTNAQEEMSDDISTI